MMRPWLTLPFLLIALFSCAERQVTPAKSDGDLRAFLLGNSYQTLMHEAGHLIIDQFNLPVLGQEEDAADNFASVALLSWNTDRGDDALWQSAVAGFIMHDLEDSQSEEAVYFDAHDLDVQRSSRIVCHFMGVDPETYGDLAKDYDLDDADKEYCEFNYEVVSANWQRMLEPHLIASKPSARIIVRYDQPNPEFRTQAALLQKEKVLENIASYLSQTYGFPSEIKLTATSCGEANAFYDLEKIEITLCYDLLAELEEYFEQDGMD